MSPIIARAALCLVAQGPEPVRAEPLTSRR